MRLDLIDRPVLLCLAAAALFGASTPASKTLLGVADPLSLSGLLYLGAALAVGPFAIRSGLPRGWLASKNLGRLAGVVLFGGVLGPILLLTSLSRAPAASTALWLNLEPVATGILAWAFFREHLPGRAWMAMVLICGGSALLAGPARFEVGPAAGLVALACLCWGIDNNLTALIDGLTPAQTTMVKGLVAGSINLGLGLWLGRGPASWMVIVLALLVGAIGYGLSLVLYIGAAQQLGAARSQMIFSTASFWGVSLAWLLLSEPRLWTQVVAGGVMLAGLWLLHSSHHEHEHRHEAITHRHWHRHDDGHHDHVHPRLPSWIGHGHEHTHPALTHTHPHHPDLQHRHGH
jgi:drug/metabolite transporter (DMT)-like permease